MAAPPPLDLIVVLDVGNSGVKLGGVREERVAGPIRLPRADGRAVKEMATPMLQGRKAIIALAGSDPGTLEGLAWEVRKLRLGTVVVVGPDHAGIPPARVEQPEKAGVDRRLQILAARHLAGCPAAVVSCGTALVVDVGDDEGALLGGAIGAGMGLATQALAAGTARLPRIDLAGEAGMPARSTESAMRAGIVLGTAGAIERLLEAAAWAAEAPVYLTGQDAPHVHPLIRREVRLHPGLALLGAALAVRRAPPLKADS